jgi:hypothetical protein
LDVSEQVVLHAIRNLADETVTSEQDSAKAGISTERVLTEEIAEDFVNDPESVDLSSYTTLSDEAAVKLSEYVDRRVRQELAQISEVLRECAEESPFAADGGFNTRADDSVGSLLAVLPFIDGLRRPRRVDESGFMCVYSFDETTATEMSSHSCQPVMPHTAYLFIDDKFAMGLADEDMRIIEGRWLRVGWRDEDEFMEGWVCEVKRLSESVALPTGREIMPEVRDAIDSLEASLDLDGLENVSKRAVGLLAKHLGDLSLGLKSLNNDAAVALAGYRGARLCLGIESLTDSAAAALSKYVGDLNLFSVERLSDAAAHSLGMHAGCLMLNGLTELSERAASGLSRHRGELWLCGLKTLSEGAAQGLASHADGLHLNGISELSDSAATALVSHRGGLHLNALQSLSDVVAKALCAHSGLLSLTGLVELSDAATAHLSKHTAIETSPDLRKRLRAARRRR